MRWYTRELQAVKKLIIVIRRLVKFYTIMQLFKPDWLAALSAGAIEYADCTSAVRKKTSLNECPDMTLNSVMEGSVLVV